MAVSYYVKLINEKKEYLNLGLRKNMNGALLLNEKIDNKCYVSFFSVEKNKFIKALVSEEDLEITENTNYYKALSFDGEEINEYYLVEIVNENEECKKHGIKKGMRGVILDPTSYKGKWVVTFTNEKTAEDIAEIAILGNDLKIIRK